MATVKIGARCIDAEALEWLIGVNSPDFADWDAFDAWIACDPAHERAYWTLVEAEQTALAELCAPAPTSVAERRLPGRWWSLAWAAGGLAAIAATLVIVMPQTSSRSIIETGSGGRRSVTLADGSHVDLNGGTRISFDPTFPRRLRLDRGEAMLSVVHDPARPFELDVGGAVIRDVGTVFDVVRDDTGAIRLAVAEGAVTYVSGDVSRSLAGGETIEDHGRSLVLGRADASSVGSWRHQQLVYDEAPVMRVVEDLERATGHTIQINPSLADRRFSGSIRLKGDPASTIVSAAGLMALNARPQGAGWRLSAGRSPAF